MSRRSIKIRFLHCTTAKMYFKISTKNHYIGEILVAEWLARLFYIIHILSETERLTNGPGASSFRSRSMDFFGERPGVRWSTVASSYLRPSDPSIHGERISRLIGSRGVDAEAAGGWRKKIVGVASIRLDEDVNAGTAALWRERYAEDRRGCISVTFLYRLRHLKWTSLRRVGSTLDLVHLSQSWAKRNLIMYYWQWFKCRGFDGNDFLSFEIIKY